MSHSHETVHKSIRFGGRTYLPTRVLYGASLTHVGRSLTHVGRSLTHFGRSLTHVGRSLTHVGRSLTHVGRSLTHVGRSLTHVGRSLTHVGRSLTRWSFANTCWSFSSVHNCWIAHCAFVVVSLRDSEHFCGCPDVSSISPVLRSSVSGQHV